eukprot:jgi/Psemu1/44299/gm1.44299_g
MPSAGGRKSGIGNYTNKAELLENMFAAISRAILDVADLHAKKFPGRDADSPIGNKFNRLHHRKI